MATPSEDALSAVTEQNESISGAKVIRHIPGFFGGELILVGFTDAANKKSENYYYSAGTSSQLFKTGDEMATFVATQKRKFIFWEYIISVVGISGLIAVVITGVISYLLIHNTEGTYQLPAILTNSLSTILGFYFGTAGSKKTP